MYNAVDLWPGIRKWFRFGPVFGRFRHWFHVWSKTYWHSGRRFTCRRFWSYSSHEVAKTYLCDLIFLFLREPSNFSFFDPDQSRWSSSIDKWSSIGRCPYRRGDSNVNGSCATRSRHSRDWVRHCRFGCAFEWHFCAETSKAFRPRSRNHSLSTKK